MAMNTGGIGYFPTEVGMLDDDKVFELMATAGGGEVHSTEAYCAYGRLMELYAQIYREGYAIRLDARKGARIAHRLGLACEGLDSFVAACVSCGLFDAGLWERERVLTSRGIQERYLIAKKRSRSGLDGPWALPADDPGKSRGIPGNRPQSSESDDAAARVPDNCPEKPAKEKGKIKEREKREEMTGDLACGMAGELPCLAAPAGGSSVFIDLADKPHRTALGAIAASYAHVGGRDPGGFASKLRGLCPGGCRGDPARADACYRLVMRALERYDPAKGSDPWPLARKIIGEEREP